MVLAGIFFGLCSFLLVEVLEPGQEDFREDFGGNAAEGDCRGGRVDPVNPPFFSMYLGQGLGTIQSALQGGSILWYAFLLKMVFTSITLNFGGSGGIVVPILFVGSTSGILFGEIFGLDSGAFAALGLVSLLAGATNTPIAASVLALELFGPEFAPYAALACVISFLMTGNRSVHPTQILAIEKSPSVRVDLGEALGNVETRFQPRERSLIGLILRLFRFPRR